ncbi:DUF6098 family protein [Streptomyces sp. NA02950]|uniref:DUF6098 family protein n=1 Tax=Streptomyces sp. NA02950 TaxID=2742137 RepID=UPI0034CFE150
MGSPLGGAHPSHTRPAGLVDVVERPGSVFARWSEGPNRDLADAPGSREGLTGVRVPGFSTAGKPHPALIGSETPSRMFGGRSGLGTRGTPLARGARHRRHPWTRKGAWRHGPWRQRHRGTDH